MNMKNKRVNCILTLILALTMVFTGLGIGSWELDKAYADETQITTVDCGTDENIEWSLDSKGRLEVTKNYSAENGQMKDYSRNASAPWMEKHREDIKTVTSRWL
jgi:hypothetical protein